MTLRRAGRTPDHRGDTPVPSLTPSTGSSPTSQIAQLATGGLAVIVTGLWIFAIRGYGGAEAGLLLGGAVAGTALVAVAGFAAVTSRRQRRNSRILETALAERHEQTLTAVYELRDVVEAGQVQARAEAEALRGLLREALAAVRAEYREDHGQIAANLEQLAARIAQINTEYPSDLAIKMYTEASATWSQQIIPVLAEVLEQAGRTDLSAKIRQFPSHRN